MAAAFSRFDTFAFDLGKKFHDFRAPATGDTLKIYLTNATPNQATNTVKANLAEFAQTTNGYTAGGAAISNTWTQSTNVGTCGGTDFTWTATADWTGNPFRYVVLYNDTTAAATDPLIGYWDFGSSVTLLNTETFTVDFGASVFTITAT